MGKIKPGLASNVILRISLHLSLRVTADLRYIAFSEMAILTMISTNIAINLLFHLRFAIGRQRRRV